MPSLLHSVVYFVIGLTFTKAQWCQTLAPGGECVSTSTGCPAGKVDSNDIYPCGIPFLRCCSGIPAQLNLCGINPCSNNGNCVQTTATTFRCDCPNGFTGDQCQTQSNLCGINPCLNSGNCVQTTATTFRCDCLNGFTGDRCQTAVNPCDNNPCLNNGNCFLTSATTFGCICGAGFTGDRCETAPNPCDSNPCLNNGFCFQPTATTFSCFCGTRFTGDRCEIPIITPSPCDSSPCLNNGNCSSTTATSVGFVCSCATGFTGDRCQTAVNPCDNNPCLNNGNCFLTSATTFGCICGAGFTGDRCEAAVSPCDNSPCLNNGNCFPTTATSFGFVCSCAVGFTGDRCQTAPNPCDNNPCLNNGICVPTTATTFICICGAGFTGDRCETAVNPCDNSPCFNNGNCFPTTATTFGFVCSCAVGFTGSRCQTAVNPCDNNLCMNSGTCFLNSATTFGCICGAGFTGDRCETAVNPCASNPCLNNGNCFQTSATTFGCVCEAGFTGDRCETFITTTTASPPQSRCGVRSSSRIFNGQDSGDTCKWPWMVSIRARVQSTAPPSLSNTVQHCNGVLIDENYVLTTANCLHTTSLLNSNGPAKDAILLVAGEYNTTGLNVVNNVLIEQFRTVSSSIIHPNNYQPDETKILGPELVDPSLDRESYNVALLKLATPFILGDCVNVPCLPSAADLSIVSNQNCVTASWGAFDSNIIPTDTLTESQINVNQPTNCGTTTTQGTTCGFFNTNLGTGICSGDNGGMVVCLDPNTSSYQLRGLINYPNFGDCTAQTAQQLIPIVDFKNPLIWNWVMNQIAPPVVTTPTLPVVTTPPPLPCGVRPPPTSRIFNGQDSGNACRWPWMISIRARVQSTAPPDLSNTVQTCNGVLVANDAVLTTANCLHTISLLNSFGPAKDAILLVAGEYNTTGLNVVNGVLTEQLNTVISSTIHPDNFQPDETKIRGPELVDPNVDRESYNVALLKLATPFTLGNCVNVPCLPSVGDLSIVSNQNCFTASWGAFDQDIRPSDTLKESPINVNQPNNCGTTTTQGTTCGFFNPNLGAGICSGDNGGMVVCMDPNTSRYQLRGLISYPNFGACTAQTAQQLLPIVDFKNPFIWTWVMNQLNN